MKSGAAILLGVSIAAGAFACGDPAGEEPPAMRRIPLDLLEEKIRGGWAGQMIGVSFGAPTEFRFMGRLVEGELQWHPDRVRIALKQDDLYVEMTFAEVMDRIGLEATTEQYGEAFKNTRYRLWHANAAARRLLNRGIKAPLSGHPKYNIHANDIDFQIEADFIGLMTPGMPGEAIRYCDRVGRVMNHGDGLYGGMFVTGMYAAAFFESDPRKIVEAGLACLPEQSGYAAVIRDTLAARDTHAEDWTRAWSEINAKWDKNDSCPTGSLTAFNIDARLNGAYIALGLLYGEGDFQKTLLIATRCGQDSDCNPSSAAGILGVVLGYEAIPEVWRGGIPPIADVKFDFTDYSFNEIVESTLRRAINTAEKAGGRSEEGELVVPVRPPEPPELEQWDMGVPDGVALATDAAWSWGEDWVSETRPRRSEVRSADVPGAEATLRFVGSAIEIVGVYGADGGRADVFLDGKRVGRIDAYLPEITSDIDYWHGYDLGEGAHEVRIVTLEGADEQSTGTRVSIEAAIIFRTAN